MENLNNKYENESDENLLKKYLNKLDDPDSKERKEFNKMVDDFIKENEENKEIVTQKSYLEWLDNFMQNQVKEDRFDDEDFAYFPEKYQAIEEDKKNVNLLCVFIYYILEPFLDFSDHTEKRCFFSINNHYYFITEVHGQGTSVMIDKLKKAPNKMYVIL